MRKPRVGGTKLEWEFRGPVAEALFKGYKLIEDSNSYRLSEWCLKLLRLKKII
jgi:hypothetical protein